MPVFNIIVRILFVLVHAFLMVKTSLGEDRCFMILPKPRIRFLKLIAELNVLANLRLSQNEGDKWRLAI